MLHQEAKGGGFALGKGAHFSLDGGLEGQVEGKGAFIGRRDVFGVMAVVHGEKGPGVLLGQGFEREVGHHFGQGEPGVVIGRIDRGHHPQRARGNLAELAGEKLTEPGEQPAPLPIHVIEEEGQGIGLGGGAQIGQPQRGEIGDGIVDQAEKLGIGGELPLQDAASLTLALGQRLPIRFRGQAPSGFMALPAHLAIHEGFADEKTHPRAVI